MNFPPVSILALDLLGKISLEPSLWPTAGPIPDLVMRGLIRLSDNEWRATDAGRDYLSTHR